MSGRYELLVIGGGPAGLAAVRAYRETGRRGAVAIVTDEERMPYARPPLTKEFLRGETNEDSLALEDEAWLDREAVSLVAGRAVRLDPERREVILAGGRVLLYRTCLLATGAEPVRPSIPGADDPAVRVIRSLDHIREFLARVALGDPVLVIGSGFIGCEIAASLAMRGHPVELVSDEPAPNTHRLGLEAAGAIAGWLGEVGVRLSLGSPVERIERRAGRLRVTVADGAPGSGAVCVEAPHVVMALGVSPRGELLAPHGLCGDDGAIAVDAAMRSGLDGVLAAGDVARAFNSTAGRALRVEHWGDALAQGAVAGRTAAGESAAWADVPGFWSTIGAHTLKYAAWGDGYRSLAHRPLPDGTGFTVWYERDGRVVGVLANDADEEYERGRELIAQGAQWTF